MQVRLKHTLFILSLCSSSLLLFGCEQVNDIQNEGKMAIEEIHTKVSPVEVNQELKSGSMLYILSDIADFQSNSSRYIEQLQQTQQQLKNAVNLQDHEQLQTKTQELKQQLTNFNQSLNSLNLKSQEIYDIRQNIITANQEVLASPYLNGKIELEKIDLKKIESQMGSVQSEMVKLASMFMQDQTGLNQNSESDS